MRAVDGRSVSDAPEMFTPKGPDPVGKERVRMFACTGCARDERALLASVLSAAMPLLSRLLLVMAPQALSVPW